MAGVCEGECMGRSARGEHLTLTILLVVGCHSYMNPLKGGSFVCGRAYNLKGVKGKFSVFLLFLKLASLLL